MNERRVAPPIGIGGKMFGNDNKNKKPKEEKEDKPKKKNLKKITVKEIVRDGMKAKVYPKHVVIYPAHEESSYSSFYMWKNPGNCKLFTLDNVGSCIRSHPDKMQDAIKFGLDFIGHYDDVFFVNLTSKKALDLLRDRFRMLFCNKVPIGYGKGSFHYYALFASHKLRDKYRKRIDSNGIESIEP